MRAFLPALVALVVVDAKSCSKKKLAGVGAGVALGGLAGRALLKRRAAAPAEATPAEGGKVNKFNVARADALLRQRTAASCDKAAAMYEAELEKVSACSLPRDARRDDT